MTVGAEAGPWRACAKVDAGTTAAAPTVARKLRLVMCVVMCSPRLSAHILHTNATLQREANTQNFVAQVFRPARDGP